MSSDTEKVRFMISSLIYTNIGKSTNCTSLHSAVRAVSEPGRLTGMQPKMHETHELVVIVRLSRCHPGSD